MLYIEFQNYIIKNILRIKNKKKRFLLTFPISLIFLIMLNCAKLCWNIILTLVEILLSNSNKKIMTKHNFRKCLY